MRIDDPLAILRRAVAHRLSEHFAIINQMQIVLLYNAPALAPEDADFKSEAGVLESVAAMGAKLRNAGHQVAELPVFDSVVDLIQSLNDSRPDVVVNLCESFAGSSSGEPHVAALLELLGLSYTGSPPECLALVRNKARTKRLLAGAGIPTAEFVEVDRGQLPPSRPLCDWLGEGPLLVKPASEDASLGIGPESVVTTWNQLVRQVAAIHERYGAALVERYLDGREFNIGIIELPELQRSPNTTARGEGDRHILLRGLRKMSQSPAVVLGLQVLPIAEIEFRQTAEMPWPIVTYDVKWATGSAQDVATAARCPADVSAELAERLTDAAVRAYQITGCRDYARIDVRTDAAGNVCVLEVNANPDVGPNAGLARMLRASGIGYEQFVERLVAKAEGRRRKAEGGKFSSKDNENAKAAAGLVSSIKALTTTRPLGPGDIATLLQMTRACGNFHSDEIKIADEVLREALRDGPMGHYHVLVAQQSARLVGWSCHGKVPLTDATYDLYWIVVEPQSQGQGIGRQLLAEVETQVRTAGGRWLLAETSSTPAYEATRAFYRRCGYRVVSHIDDFYRLSDGRVTYGKRLSRCGFEAQKSEVRIQET